MLIAGIIFLVIIFIATFNYCRIKKNTGTHWFKNMMLKNQKIYILVIGIGMYCCIVCHYGIEIQGIWYEQLGLIEIFLRYSGLYTIVYFVFRKASKPLKNKWKYINYGIKPAIFFSFICNVALLIYVEAKIIKINSAKDQT